MKKQFVMAVLAAFSLSMTATAQNLKGFAYGDVEAPRGYGYEKGQAAGLVEWESPEELALNKEQPKAWFFTFRSAFDRLQDKALDCDYRAIAVFILTVGRKHSARIFEHDLIEPLDLTAFLGFALVVYKMTDAATGSDSQRNNGSQYN